MRKLIYTIALPLSIIFGSCSDNDDVKFGDLKVNDKKELKQSLSADDNSASVSFTADDNWTADVTDATNTRAGLSWLTLDRYEGTAGSYTLKMTIRDNTTGADRKAVITVKTAGGDKFEVEVTQVKTNKDGTTPEAKVALVDKIKYNYTSNSYYEDDYESTVQFKYDGNNMVTEMILTDDEGDVYERYYFTYDKDKITVVMHDDIEDTDNRTRTISGKSPKKSIFNRKSSRGANTRAEVYQTCNYTFNLNESGYISSATYNFGEDWHQDWEVSYDTDGYLKNVDYNKDNLYTTKTVTCSWSDGNLTKVKTEEGSASYFSTAAYDNSIDNSKANIDFNFLVQEADEYYDIDESEFMGILGFYGKRSKGLMKSSLATDDEGTDYGTQKYSYTFDSDGLIIGAKVVDTDVYDDGDKEEYIMEYTISYK